MPHFNRQTIVFSLNSFAAAMLALYIAFALDLPRPYWAMMTVYITSNPLSGAIRSKAVYRMAGTLIGAAAMLVLVPNLVASPLLLSFALSVWVSGCVAIALLDRTPRSYMLLLAGYSAALIGFPSVNQPDAVFDIAVARVEEIGLGIICVTLVHSLFFPQPVGDALPARLVEWLGAADRWLIDLTQGGHAAESDRNRRQLAAATGDIRIMATHLPFDTSRLRDTGGAIQAMHERMLMLVPLLSGVADRRQALDDVGRRLPRAVEARLTETAAWVQAGAPHAQGLNLVSVIRQTAGARSQGDWRDLLIESLLTRLAEAVSAIAECHALVAHLRTPDAPVPTATAQAIANAVERPMHADLGLALRSGVACFTSVMIVCVIWIGTGWPEGAAAASVAALFCGLLASLDDPAPAIVYFSLAALTCIALGAFYVFAVFPAIDGFPLLAAVLLPHLFLVGLYTANPATAIMAAPWAITFGSALALQETYNANMAAYLNGNLAIFVATFVTIFVMRAMRSMTAEAMAQRLLRLTWRSIAGLARRGALRDPGDFAAVLVDRLAMLAPRLGLQGAAGDGVAQDALRDVRVAMNLMSLRQTRSYLTASDRSGLGPPHGRSRRPLRRARQGGRTDRA